jgi:hypothetical protein
MEYWIQCWMQLGIHRLYISRGYKRKKDSSVIYVSSDFCGGV